MSEPATPPPGPAAQRLTRLASRAAYVIGWERVWPPIAVALTVVGLFLAVSFLGLWLETPRWARIAGVIAFGFALAVALARLSLLRPPVRAERLARLDRDSGLPHRPATSLDDTLANAGGDPAAQALWALHRRRAERAAAQLRLAAPSPRMVERDRFAVRAAALVAVAAAAFVAGPEKYARVLAAFDWRTPGALSQAYRIDAWIDPPAYTGRPPVVLNLRDDAGAPARGERAFAAPVGSIVIVRASEGANVSAAPEGGVELLKPEDAAAAAGKTAAASAKPTDAELRYTLKRDGKLSLMRFGATVATFVLTAIPDKPPTIALKGDPKPNARGSLTLAYTINDDYGVIGADARFSDPVVAGKPVKGRSLVEPPKMPLALPGGQGGLGDGETTADLSDHAWAGARVTMTLAARDEGGNEGRSPPIQVTLPQRPFTKPLARALVEQRRNLILAPDDRSRVGLAMEALLIAPDAFNTPPSVYLGLRSILTRLKEARSDADLVGAADLMWEMALRLEGGDLSDAERDLRSAEQQLRDAMQRGASPEEIQKLMDQLRAAMDKFLNQMAQQQRDTPDAQQQTPNPNARTVTPKDLQSMLDRMQDLMKNGDTAQAQQLLDQLRNMMENLQTARGPSRPNPMAREMNRSLDELDRLTREEQELRDKTFQHDRRNQAQRGQRQGQRQRGPNQPGMRGDQQDDQADGGDEDDNDQSADNETDQSLQDKQQALRQRLDALRERMKQFGMDGKESMDDAENSMKDAEGQLGNGQQGRGKAVDAQGRAIDALRRGAQALAQQMQQGGQMGEGGGPGQPNGPMREGRDNPNRDPLGRESHDRRDASRAPYDPLGVPLAQRAQRVLEELRKRLGDPTRPQEELDYLERLLNRY